MKKFSRFTVVIFAIAGVSGAVSVALAAFADHGLAQRVADGPRAVRLFMQAADFELKHALAAIVAALLAERVAEGGGYKAFRAAAVLFTAGAVLFPTALYTSALGGPAFWAPWGGTAAIAGWICFTIAAALSLRKGGAA